MARFKLDPKTPPTLSAAEAARLDAMSDAEITSAALSDSDNPPLSDDELALAAMARKVREVRAQSGLTQTRFAQEYRINVGRLRDLEQGRTKPDSAMLAYLTVIEKAPEAVKRALSGAKR